MKPQILTKKLILNPHVYVSYDTYDSPIRYDLYDIYLCIGRFISTYDTPLRYETFCTRYDTYRVSYDTNNYDYASWALRGAEERYPSKEKLAFALVTATCKLKPYFQAHTVIVLTDKPL